MSFDRALSNRRRVPRRTGKPVFGSLRSAVWNTATFASRVFDGLPSFPFPWSCGWGMAESETSLNPDTVDCRAVL